MELLRGTEHTGVDVINLLVDHAFEAGVEQLRGLLLGLDLGLARHLEPSERRLLLGRLGFGGAHFELLPE